MDKSGAHPDHYAMPFIFRLFSMAGLWHSTAGQKEIEDNGGMKRTPTDMADSANYPTDASTLSDRIEDLLPQTQCTKCGYSGCRPYAEAIASGSANYNQCPPGGQEGIERLARLLGKPIIALNVENGVERPRPVA